MTVLTPEDEAVFAAADVITDAALDAATECGEDPVYVLFGVWVNLTRLLASEGWTPEELMRDVGSHAADQVSEGRA
jgi:hypothetical protein